MKMLMQRTPNIGLELINQLDGLENHQSYAKGQKIQKKPGLSSLALMNINDSKILTCTGGM